MTKLYANGVRIGDWFYREDGIWLHFHNAKIPFGRKWIESVEGICPRCEEEVPKEIKMHGRLQKLGYRDPSGTTTYWPVTKRDAWDGM